ncbi:GPN-loop GTPase [Nematocida homosporus]|uniref:GPN-loop GTPase n=1 Tax=Nematocida homosporus TaxID=1912981 RepID=UPI00221FF00E|nr:GPN-loop GTPase [Nematocida homosporus]KAI5186722.1 GPN-loop GTPase [Nematocida homosporus]
MTHQIFIVLGMAGSGKTTFCHRLYSWLSEKSLRLDNSTGLNNAVFGVNLDPAVLTSKMPLHYDIRDVIAIEELMTKKKLGPNGAILAVLNLFITQIDKFMTEIDKVKPDFTIIDTPGQIEMFTTSVSGQILTKCLSATPDTKVHLLYVVDGEKAQYPQCFISNMLFAASIQCHLKESLLLVVNKADLPGAEALQAWTQDMDLFTQDLSQEEYITPTIRSMALWLEEFYQTLPFCPVSATTGMGKAKFFSLLQTPSSSTPSTPSTTSPKQIQDDLAAIRISKTTSTLSNTLENNPTQSNTNST